MRIGIDIRPLGSASGGRGVGTYIRGLLSGLERELEARGADRRDDVVLFSHRQDERLEPPTRFKAVRLSRPRRGITLWDQIAWPLLLSRRRIAVFHSPFYAVPRWRPSGCRVVQTIHDLTPLKLPGSVPARAARVFRANFQLARAADRIIVPSETTRGDVADMLGIALDRVTVVPEACDITPAEIAAADQALPRTLARLGLQQPYLIHSGGHDMVKNLTGVINAFAALAVAGRDLMLVIAGAHGPLTPSLIAACARLGVLDRVRLPGFVPRADLIALYRGASALVYPSLAEGFGLPLLEAMTCGLPVVASRAGALREVGGEACVYADSVDPASIAAACARVLDDDDLAADLSRRGRERAAGYSWRTAARRTLEVYEEAAA